MTRKTLMALSPILLLATLVIPPDAQSSSLPGGVTVYNDVNYEGARETLTEDDPDLGDNAIGNDAISSLHVAAGCTVTLYQHADYQGASEIFTSNDPSLLDNAIGNDSATSIKIRCKAPESGVVLYQHTEYQGTHESFDGNDPDLGDNVIGNDAASSIRVPQGCTATLYQHADYQGSSETFSSDDPSLLDNVIGNDSATSIEVNCGYQKLYSYSAGRFLLGNDIPAEARRLSVEVSAATSIPEYLRLSAQAATNTVNIGVWKNVYPAIHIDPNQGREKPTTIILRNMYQLDQLFSDLFSAKSGSQICGPAAMANALNYLKSSHNPGFARILEQSLPGNATNADIVRILFDLCKTDREKGTWSRDLRNCAVRALKEGAYYDTGDVFIHGISSSTKSMPPGPAALRALGAVTVSGDETSSTIGAAAVLLFGWYFPEDPGNDGIFQYVRKNGHFVTFAGYDDLEKDYLKNDRAKNYTFYVSNPLVDYNRLHPNSPIRYSKIGLEAVPGRIRVQLPEVFKQDLYQAWQTRDLVGGALAVLEDIVVVRP